MVNEGAKQKQSDTVILPWLQKFLSSPQKKNEDDKKIDGENDAESTDSPARGKKLSSPTIRTSIADYSDTCPISIK